MNWMLLTAALLVLGAALAHSLLGEKVVLRRIYRHAGSDATHTRRAADDPVTRQTLRLAWHSLSVALVGFAALLVLAAVDGAAFGLSWRGAMRAMSLTFGGLALLSLAVARGRHVGWMWFAAVAAATWVSVD